MASQAFDLIGSANKKHQLTQDTKLPSSIYLVSHYNSQLLPMHDIVIRSAEVLTAKTKSNLNI